MSSRAQIDTATRSPLLSELLPELPESDYGALKADVAARGMMVAVRLGLDVDGGLAEIEP